MKNLYYKQVYQSKNSVKHFLEDLAGLFGEVAHKVLVVFLKRDLGERYFHFFTALKISFVLLIPVVLNNIFIVPNLNMLRSLRMDWLISLFLSFNQGWLVFILGYLAVAFIRHRERSFSLTKYDFSLFSLSQGRSTIPWDKFLPGKFNNPVIIDCVLEPLMVFIISLVLLIIPYFAIVGLFLFFFSFFYSSFHWSKYYSARWAILDRNDERICNEDIASIFSSEQGLPAEPKNLRIRFPLRGPDDEKIRTKLHDNFFDYVPEAQ